MQVKKQQLELDMEQLTHSKLGKEGGELVLLFVSVGEKDGHRAM